MRSHQALLEDNTRVSFNQLGQYITNTSNIGDHILKVDTNATEFYEKERNRQEVMFNQVREWLSSADIGSDHHNICLDRSYYSRTGDWILSHPKVQGLFSQNVTQFSNSVLWINGRPGAGKTYLASILIEACKKESWTTGYFYFNEKTDNKNTAIAALRGILFQLVQQHRDLVAYCFETMNKPGNPILSDIRIAKTILKVFCERIPQLYVVIDALDECEDRKSLLDIFIKYLIPKFTPGKLRLLVHSRPSPEIKNALSTANVLALTAELNAQDIRSYCQFRTRELQKFDFDDQTLNNVMEMIHTRADGIFLFAKLVMDNLARQPTQTRFCQEITETRLPYGLNQAYTQIMERLKKDLSPAQFEYTQLLLGWIVCSKRPLKWTEIQAALSVNLNGSNEVDRGLRLVDDVRELCGSLVQVLEGDRIELVHSTARSFISEHNEIKIAASERDLTLRCLRYLTLNIFEPGICDEDLRRCALRGDFAFQDYAVSAWFMHIKSMIDAKQNFLESLLIDQAPNVGSNQLDQIFFALRNFVDFYDETFEQENIPEQVLRDCEFFRTYPFYDDLILIWNHIYTEQRKDLTSRNSVSIDLLKNTLTRNRELLETLSTTENLSHMYGEKLFRCPKVLCFYFHEGFENYAARNYHIDCHERPFRCTVLNCVTSGMGFASSVILKRHMRTFHPLECDLSESFAPLNMGSTNSHNPWHCSDCSKSFKRKVALTEHMRRHRGEKPFTCSECGRGFARKSDMKRHENVHKRGR